MPGTYLRTFICHLIYWPPELDFMNYFLKLGKSSYHQEIDTRVLHKVLVTL